MPKALTRFLKSSLQRLVVPSTEKENGEPLAVLVPSPKRNSGLWDARARVRRGGEYLVQRVWLGHVEQSLRENLILITSCRVES